MIIVACRKKGMRKAAIFSFKSEKKAQTFIKDAKKLGFDVLRGEEIVKSNK